MALIRWEPLQEVESLQREMNRLFETLTPQTGGNGNGIAFMPSAEMQETPDAVHLKLEIPGVDAKDFDVQVTAEAISISGDRKSETRTEAKGMVRSEFRYGKFQRVIPLPVRIQQEHVQADYKDGILALTLPKAEDEKNKVVKVNIAQADA